MGRREVIYGSVAVGSVLAFWGSLEILLGNKESALQPLGWALFGAAVLGGLTLLTAAFYHKGS